MSRCRPNEGFTVARTDHKKAISYLWCAEISCIQDTPIAFVSDAFKFGQN